MNDIPHDLTGFDHARPPGLGRHTNATFEKVTLAATEDGFGHAEPRWWVVGHGPVVRHGDDQGILGDPQFLELRHDFADEGVNIALQAILQDAARHRTLLRVGEKTRQVGPVGDIKGFTGFGIALDKFQGTSLGFGVNLQVVFVAIVAPLAGLLTLFALGNLHPSFGHEGVV